MTSATVIAAVALGIPIIALLITDIRARWRELELRLVDRRQAAYQQFMTDMSSVTSSAIANPAADPAQEAVDAMRTFNNTALLVSADEVVRRWLKLQAPAVDAQQRMRRYARLLIAMRRDMGNARTKLSPAEAMKTIIKAEDWPEVDHWFASADD